MKKSAMQDAIKARRAKGLDLSIIVGGAEPLNSDDVTPSEHDALEAHEEGESPTEEHDEAMNGDTEEDQDDSELAPTLHEDDAEKMKEGLAEDAHPSMEDFPAHNREDHAVQSEMGSQAPDHAVKNALMSHAAPGSLKHKVNAKMMMKGK